MSDLRGFPGTRLRDGLLLLRSPCWPSEPSQDRSWQRNGKLGPGGEQLTCIHSNRAGLRSHFCAASQRMLSSQELGHLIKTAKCVCPKSPGVCERKAQLVARDCSLPLPTGWAGDLGSLRSRRDYGLEYGDIWPVWARQRQEDGSWPGSQGLGTAQG